MINKKELEKKLKDLKPVLEEKFKVKSIGVFGSYARAKAEENSDIDILVEFTEDIGWEFIDLKYFLEENLETEVDLVTKEALKPEIKEDILNDVIYQWEETYDAVIWGIENIQLINLPSQIFR